MVCADDAGTLPLMLVGQRPEARLGIDCTLRSYGRLHRRRLHWVRSLPRVTSQLLVHAKVRGRWPRR